MSNVTVLHKRLSYVNRNAISSLLEDRREGFVLESSLGAAGRGRFSFIGVDPFLAVTSKHGIVREEGQGIAKKVRGSIFEYMRLCLKRYRVSVDPRFRHIPLQAGAIGFFSYDAGIELEGITQRKDDDIGVPDAWFGFFNQILCIDHMMRSVYLFDCGYGMRSRTRTPQKFSQQFERFVSLLTKKDAPVRMPTRIREALGSRSLTSNMKRDEYLDAVTRVRNHIIGGDIYQLNLSQRFHATTQLAAEQLYRNLRNVFPVPFGGILKTKEMNIISGSPERFLKYDGTFLYTRPMKGTRPRSRSPMRDRQHRHALAMSRKDQAELLMIVDLERNDLGRVCDYGSIAVEELRTLETYASVYQATAQVRGRLFGRHDRIDSIKACFPGGSITGCPKIRAMQIIDELEPHRRSIYTGSLGYFSFHNTMDFNILIRSFVQRGRDVYFGVGGGIVYDSTPISEYHETLVKAKALRQALAGSAQKHSKQEFHVSATIRM